MKILYAIQGTGNGHISRSKEVLKHLVKKADVDILVSESQHEVDLGFKIKYKLDGLGFVFGKKGGIDYFNSIKKVRLDKFLSDIYDLPVENYDVVISDFEPIASWACRRKKKNYVSLSHQTSFMSDKMPRPKKSNHLAELIIKWYAPVSIPIGLHYEKYDNFIETPIIREEIRNAEVSNNNHYTVYLPSFDEKYLLKKLNSIDVKWEYFSKHYKGNPYVDGKVKIYPINNEWFVESLSTCEGILCNSGFETPSEALHMGKKILAIPMKGQWEQECNAEALKKLGIKILTSIEDDFEKELGDWVNSDFIYKSDFKDNIPFIVDFILESSAYNDFDNNSLNNIPPFLSDGNWNSIVIEQ
ncbi:MAG: glycosyltransferase family protein [Thermodesulfobacteriota bacterium]